MSIVMFHLLEVHWEIHFLKSPVRFTLNDMVLKNDIPFIYVVFHFTRKPFYIPYLLSSLYQTMLGSPNFILWVSRLKLGEVQYSFRLYSVNVQSTLSLKCEQQLLWVLLTTIKTWLSAVSEQASHSFFLTVPYPRDYCRLTGFSKGELSRKSGFMIIDRGGAK